MALDYYFIWDAEYDNMNSIVRSWDVPSNGIVVNRNWCRRGCPLPTKPQMKLHWTNGGDMVMSLVGPLERVILVKSWHVVTMARAHEMLMKVDVIDVGNHLHTSVSVTRTSCRRQRPHWSYRQLGCPLSVIGRFLPLLHASGIVCHFTLLQHHRYRLLRRGWSRFCSSAVSRPNLLYPITDATLFST